MQYDYNLLEIATSFAIESHGDQLYGDKPYLYHLSQVENNVIRILGVTAFKERIVAILHDTMEDTAVTHWDIKQRFGMEVAEAVLALSKFDDEDYYQYIERVRANPVALLVKKCDTMANLTQSFVEQRHKGIIKYTTQLQLLEAK